MFYLTTHSRHFTYGYMASDIWLRTIPIVRKETRCRHIGYSFRLTARVLLYAASNRQDSTYHGLCYTSRGVLVGTRNISMGPPHEGSIRWPFAPWANALTTELHLATESECDTRSNLKSRRLITYCNILTPLTAWTRVTRVTPALFATSCFWVTRVTFDTVTYETTQRTKRVGWTDWWKKLK